MKTFIKIMVLFLVISSCNREKDLVFSCDPNINLMVHQKSAELQSLNLDQFLSMNIEMQRATFRSYTSQKRYELWNEKLQRVINSCEWEGSKLNHLIILKEFLTPDYFKDVNNLTELPHNQYFVKNWLISALTSLNMNKVELSFLVSSLYFDYRKFLNDLTNQVDPNNPTGPCLCNVLSDFCSTPGEIKICISNGCITAEGGCGWLWLEACNGQCVIIE